MANELPPVDLDRLEKAFRTLRPIEREVFRLSAKEGLADDEIAARLRMSPRQIERLMACAIYKLDRLLECRERSWRRFW